MGGGARRRGLSASARESNEHVEQKDEHETEEGGGRPACEPWAMYVRLTSPSARERASGLNIYHGGMVRARREGK